MVDACLPVRDSTALLFCFLLLLPDFIDGYQSSNTVISYKLHTQNDPKLVRVLVVV